KEAGYEHPHGHVRLEVPGKVWLVVLAPPTRMESRGLPAAKLRVGGKATVVGYPHRSNEDEMRAERITIEGATVELRCRRPALASPGGSRPPPRRRRCASRCGSTRSSRSSTSSDS